MEISSFFSTHEPKVRSLAERIRGNWSIENCQHHVLDLTVAEDTSRIRRGTSPEISGSVRRMALNVLQLGRTVKNNILGKRLRAGWDDNVPERIWTYLSGS